MNVLVFNFLANHFELDGCSILKLNIAGGKFKTLLFAIETVAILTSLSLFIEANELFWIK